MHHSFRCLISISTIFVSFSILLSRGLPALASSQAASEKDLSVSAFADSEAERYTKLTDSDYQKVADQLGIEVATIKAVCDIEAGKSHRGFVTPGSPIINFQPGMFRDRLRAAGYDVRKCQRTHRTAFAPVNCRRYKGYGNAQYARLISAQEIDSDIALECTFWGMFQIGGFNWRSCDVASIDEFVDLMSQSEAMQLELFARFITNNGMLQYLQRKDWRGFARAYNGASALSRGYHRRMAAAYNKYR